MIRIMGMPAPRRAVRAGRRLAAAFALALIAAATSAAETKEAATMPVDPTTPEHAALVEQVRAAETAFAATMAARDHAAFGTFIAPEAVFFGSRGPLRGAAAVTAAWARFFEGPQAPFSWRPETVEVLESGALALTSGPVFDPDGTLSGTFSTIWRRDADGRWRVVFDKGCPVCEAAKP